MSGQTRFLVGSSLLASGHQAGEALVPVLIGVVIDQAVAGGSVGDLALWLGALAATFAALSSCYRFAVRASERAAEQSAHDLRTELSRRVLDPRGGAEEGHLPGALVNIATEDARRVGAIASAVPFGVSALAGVAVTAVVLLRMSVPLGLLILLGAPPLLWLIHLVGKPLERRSGLEQQRAADASGIAADLVGGLRILKGIGAESAAIARYHRTSRDSLDASVRSAGARAWHNGAILAMNGVFIAVVALVGGRLAAGGALSVGELVSAVGLAQFLLGPLSIFTMVNARLAQGRASAERVAAVLAAPHAVAAGAERLPEPVRGRVRFRGVSHAALAGADFDIAAGELVGVVTTSPSTATALLECLARDVDPASGSVELDGVALSCLDPAEARRALLVAAHDADLFEGTVLDNVRCESERDSAPAIRAAGVDEVARALPDGLDTALTERGHSLSGGQRQRVALARALAADPPVLVVHDPTTAVDAVTEARIAAGIREIRRSRTTVLVTTSPALLAVTDRVLVLDGTSVRHGHHSELVDDENYRTAVLA
ncbi:ABC transporter protein, ATP-binding component [Saccharopolyspora erythraea NRRL 2338]|uniref:ABC transporter protein, ATP-binding component n=4 Tax=Saccharopolyspora erythraea TaxID=1836 RepID=A4FE41_SACEN|nr:ABC transporter ATP-binding protein [Saccharopolyspora erythraea]QRK93575.1 ABC transporter ATP-binding protein [Saccharopolyspora erythraea]CAM02316.1 ABC transporter protein, ATP-binding component [Saccharopolyspora erythraea NRRL 2338]